MALPCYTLFYMDYYLLAKLGHFIGIALGVGGAVASDLLFLRSIKDRKISEDEVALLSQLSVLLWTGLIVLLVSGLSFMWIQYEQTGVIKYLASEPFLAKMTIFGFLFANAFVFHAYIFPKMKQAVTEDTFHVAVEEHAGAFAIVGSISIVSWLYLFLLGIFRGITPKYFTYEQVLAIYALLLLIAITVSYFMLSRKNGGKHGRNSSLK